MSDISRKIIDTVKKHINEYNGGDSDVHISMEGDLEAQIDAVLLDTVFPVREVVE